MGSNGKITLPRDAEGREIPRSTEVMYDANGKKLHITSFTYKCDVLGLWAQWKVFSPDIKGDDGMLPANSLYLTKPDSWEKLLDDLDNASKGGDNAECLYMRREDIEVGEQCSGCRLYNADDVFSDCSCLAYGDIADRIRKLRGED